MKEGEKVDSCALTAKFSGTQGSPELSNLIIPINGPANANPLFALFYLNPLMVQSFCALTCLMFALPLVTIDNLISKSSPKHNSTPNLFISRTFIHFTSTQ